MRLGIEKTAMVPVRAGISFALTEAMCPASAPMGQIEVIA
jgi:hypothetical protein